MKETSPPRDSRVVAGHSMEMLAAGLARDGVGGERSTSDISGSPGSPSPKEGGRDRQSKTRQALLEKSKQDFQKQTQTKTSKPRSKKGKGDTRTPNKRKQNSIWVATMTKSKDNKHKHAWVRGESALEVRRTWISK